MSIAFACSSTAAGERVSQLRASTKKRTIADRAAFSAEVDGVGDGGGGGPGEPGQQPKLVDAEAAGHLVGGGEHPVEPRADLDRSVHQGAAAARVEVGAARARDVAEAFAVDGD